MLYYLAILEIAGFCIRFVIFFNSLFQKYLTFATWSNMWFLGVYVKLFFPTCNSIRMIMQQSSFIVTRKISSCFTVTSNSFQ